MTPLSVMLIAGEPSGDRLAAELVQALRRRVIAQEELASLAAPPRRTELAPAFFGAGGAAMEAAGVDLAFDLTRHSVIGVVEVARKYLVFRRMFRQLLQLAGSRLPDVVVGVDFGGFNLRFARAVRRLAAARRGPFHNWRPRLVQFVSPQVWASRPGRAARMAETHDLLLSIFPFEKAWYAKRAPRLAVEFVGHPIFDRYEPPALSGRRVAATPRLLLLPGSRNAELKRHVPVMMAALALVRQKLPVTEARMVVPAGNFVEQARALGAGTGIEVQADGLPEALAWADAALSKTGTVTIECAYFRVPTVTCYKASWSLYQIGKRVVTVPSLTMPNLLAGEPVFPEFVQDGATPDALAGAVLPLLTDGARREQIRQRLDTIVASLGGPGAADRAAQAILRLL